MRATGAARLLACWWDYLIIVAWVALLTVVGLVLHPVTPTTSSPVIADGAVFCLTVLPVGVYLTLTESGPRQATWGKHRAGLRVVTTDGQRPGLLRIALRAAVKLSPWQLAHVAMSRLILKLDAPLIIGATYSLSLFVALLSVGMAWRDPLRRALHDRAAGTLVVQG